jgi:hypothetical protein
MDKETGAVWLVVIAGFLLVVGTLVSVRTISYNSGVHDIRTHAVEVGCGEWVVEPNGTTTFKWKETDDE